MRVHEEVKTVTKKRIMTELRCDECGKVIADGKTDGSEELTFYSVMAGARFKYGIIDLCDIKCLLKNIEKYYKNQFRGEVVNDTYDSRKMEIQAKDFLYKE